MILAIYAQKLIISHLDHFLRLRSRWDKALPAAVFDLLLVTLLLNTLDADLAAF